MHRHGGAFRPGRKTGLHSELRASNPESEARQMAEVSVWRGRPTAAAGLPGRRRAAEPACVADRRRAAATHRRLRGRRLPEQGGLLCEEEDGGAKPSNHEGEPVVRGVVLRATRAVFCSGRGGE